MSTELTLIDAEKLFKSYGCTHFHMHREDPGLHSRYLNLKISREQENAWTKESFYELADQLEEAGTATNRLWWVHSRATTLAEYAKDIDILSRLESVSRMILRVIPVNEAIMCAESLLDSRDISQKCSVIFIAEDRGQHDLAKTLAECAQEFIDRSKDTDEDRAKKAQLRLELTKEMLSG